MAKTHRIESMQMHLSRRKCNCLASWINLGNCLQPIQCNVSFHLVTVIKWLLSLRPVIYLENLWIYSPCHTAIIFDNNMTVLTIQSTQSGWHRTKKLRYVDTVWKNSAHYGKFFLLTRFRLNNDLFIISFLPYVFFLMNSPSAQ